MSYADKKAKREQEIAGLKEALTILSGEAFLQVRNIEDLSSMIMPALLFFSNFVGLAGIEPDRVIIATKY